MLIENQRSLGLCAVMLAATVLLPTPARAEHEHGKAREGCEQMEKGGEHHGWFVRFFRRLFHHDDDDRGEGKGAQDCRVLLDIGTVTYSIWGDGTVALAIPLVNEGDSPAAAVQVSSLTFSRGKRAKPVTLPIALGEILSEQRSVVQSRFTSLRAPGNYIVAIAGTYTHKGVSHRFNARRQVALARPIPGPTAPVTVIVPKNATRGVPTPPSAIPQENDNNPAGPPIPDGPVIHPFTVAPTNTGAAPAAGASGVTFIRDTGGGQVSGAPPDPTTAAGGGVVFSSGNTYGLFSQDDGVTFTQIDPTTIFPQSDGGLCCDQVILYNPAVNLFFWLLQYNSSPPNPPNSGLPGPNRLRIAWASPASMKANINLWTYVDLQSSSFNLGNQALDFPDLAFTNQFLYASVDRMTAGGSVPGIASGLIVARIALTDITGPGTNVGATYFGPAESTDQNTATGSRLTQNGRDTMYWGGHVDASHIKVFRWRDSSNNVDERHDAQVNTFCQNDYTTRAPDNQQWLDSSRTSASAIIGATRKPFSGIVPPGGTPPNGEVWLAWGAGREGPISVDGVWRDVFRARVDDTPLNWLRLPVSSEARRIARCDGSA
jgi:hypothetical protein